MNINIVKEKINRLLGKNVTLIFKGMRNKKEIYEGKIYKLYPNIFSLMTSKGEKSFSYADVATNDIIIKY